MKKMSAVFILSVFLTPFCQAETACVYKYRGEVAVLEPGSAVWQTLVKAVPLKEGTRVKTGPKSSCEILAGDGTLMEIGANSETVVETLKLEKDNTCAGAVSKNCVPQTARRDYGFNLIRGKIMWLVSKVKAKISRLEVRTPRAVCAVRGTGFTILVSSDTSNIGLFEGMLDVRAGGTETALSPGKEALVGSDAQLHVNERFSKLMQAEQRRYLTLQKYVEKIRKKMAAREGFIDSFLDEQDKKLKDREERVRERLKKRGTK